MHRVTGVHSERRWPHFEHAIRRACFVWRVLDGVVHDVVRSSVMVAVCSLVAVVLVAAAVVVVDVVTAVVAIVIVGVVVVCVEVCCGCSCRSCC